MRKVAIFCIRLYQWSISPLIPPHCRYYPSCSEYAVVALQRHGIRTGIFLSIRRILRCHPFRSGGVDPVPTIEEHDQAARQKQMQRKQRRESRK